MTSICEFASVFYLTLCFVSIDEFRYGCGKQGNDLLPPSLIVFFILVHDTNMEHMLVICVVQFAPIDTPMAVQKFLLHWAPQAAIFMESELWPNLVLETALKSVRFEYSSDFTCIIVGIIRPSCRIISYISSCGLFGVTC